MSTGPSKEELENYWQTSRRYFDELAKYYQQADPSYYEKYILPYYNNPFKVSGTPSGSKARVAVAVAMVVLIIILSAAVYLLMGSPGDEDKSINEQRTVSYDSSVTLSHTNDKEPVTTGADTSFHFKKGIEMYRKKNYRAAERLLKGVSESDPLFEEARKILNAIEEESKAQEKNDKNKTGSKTTTVEKETGQIKNTDTEKSSNTETDKPRTVRPKAKERIR